MTARGKPNQTLSGHLQDSLEVFRRYWKDHNQVVRLKLQQWGWDEQIILPLLEWAVYTHDMGKATQQWQEYLAGKRGMVTHALPSLGASAACCRGGESDRAAAARVAALLAILSHHRMLSAGAFQGEKMRTLGALDYLPEMAALIQDCNCSQLDLSIPELRTVTGSELARQVKLLEEALPDLGVDLLEFKALFTLIHALVRLCDAEASRAYGQRQPVNGELADRLLGLPGSERYLYQLSATWSGFGRTPAAETSNTLQLRVRQLRAPNLIINAGCGGGKTGAALHYARELFQLQVIDRLIFTLPTQFTTNSMFWDFQQVYGLPARQLGIYHSEVDRVLTNTELEDERDPWEIKLESSYFNQPINVCTVDHLLYSLMHCHRYADRAFGNLVTSAVIFDEIHYYDQYTLRKIGQCWEVLRRLQIPHLVMSATMPRFFRQQLQLEGEIDQVNYEFVTLAGEPEAAREPFSIEQAGYPVIDSQGRISDQWWELVRLHLGQRQLVVVNQVERAKLLARAIQQQWPGINVVCYHSEFTRPHRSAKERIIKTLFTSQGKRTSSQRQLLQQWDLADTDQVIVVSTQVCELSLDISADVLYSELAPVDAVVQRGGRLHRNGKAIKRQECDCIFCTQRSYLNPEHRYVMYLFPLEWESRWALMPYAETGGTDILRQSWLVLQGPYSFAAAQLWVDQVYPDPPELTDREMMQMIREDAVFGRSPAERFGHDAEASQGSFQARLSRVAAITVLPASCRDIQGDQLALVNQWGIKVNRGKLMHHQDRLFKQDQLYYFDLTYHRETGFHFPE